MDDLSSAGLVTFPEVAHGAGQWRPLNRSAESPIKEQNIV